jgi:dTMP kinase
MKGRIITIEGIDGVGKSTQSQLLVERLRSQGYSVVSFDFPEYEQSPFGNILRRFLSGEFGDPIAMDPFATALLFAGDRYHARAAILEARQNNDFLVINRYVPSNLAYGCAKLALQQRLSERSRLIAYTEQLEYEMLGLPRPDLVVFLDAEPSKTEAQLHTRYYETGIDRKDAYERSLDLQNLAVQQYRYLSLELPKWITVDTAGQSILEVHESIATAITAVQG